jgi:hypothetical protein
LTASAPAVREAERCGHPTATTRLVIANTKPAAATSDSETPSAAIMERCIRMLYPWSSPSAAKRRNLSGS